MAATIVRVGPFVTGAGKAPAAVALVLALLAQPAAAFTNGELAGARTAIANIDKGKWADARQTAERARFPLLAKLVEWTYMTRPGMAASFDEVTRFIDQNQDWPMQAALRRRAEEAIDGSAPSQAIIAWFQRLSPVTPVGASHYIDALLANSKPDQAAATARQFLIDGAMGKGQLAQFVTRYSGILRPTDFQLRVDRLIWTGDIDEAKELLPQLPPQAKAIDQVRIALSTQARNAPALLDQLSQEQQNDLGVLYERMRWLRRHDQDAAAIALLEIAPPTLPHAELWSNERAILARRALELNDPKTAYKLSRDHRQASGSALADGEWMAGWISLRFLNDAKAALGHFQRMLANVQTPISVSRGAYWAGRAQEALGDQVGAQIHYQQAAQHIGSFYGQLALAKVNPSANLALPLQPAVAGLEERAFGNRELVQVAQLFRAIGKPDRADPFIRRVGELARTPDDALLAMRLAKANNSLAAEVSVSKKLMQGGMQLLVDGYPSLTPFSPKAPEAALVHAIIRQESLFDSGAVSPSGALGLMQLMPATAKGVANKLKLKKHKTELLTKDSRYNVTLGSAYLEELVDRFGGSYVLAVAGYNAGPGRVGGWVRDNGSPGAKLEDVIDWIEKIGAYETRNYVQRVIENLGVYRARMARNLSAPNTIERDLTR